QVRDAGELDAQIAGQQGVGREAKLIEPLQVAAGDVVRHVVEQPLRTRALVDGIIVLDTYGARARPRIDSDRALYVVHLVGKGAENDRVVTAAKVDGQGNAGIQGFDRDGVVARARVNSNRLDVARVLIGKGPIEADPDTYYAIRGGSRRQNESVVGR